VADRYNFHNVHVLLAVLQHTLAGTVTLNFGAGRMRTQVFAGQAKGFAAIKDNFQSVRGPVQSDAGGAWTHAQAENSLPGRGTGGAAAMRASKSIYAVPKPIEPMPSNS